MSVPKFGVMAEVWFASTTQERESIRCPDCGGSGNIRVLLFDGTELKIECQRCTRGWLGPDGLSHYQCHRPDPKQGLVVSVSQNMHQVEYTVETMGQSGTLRYCMAEDRVFPSQLLAMEASEQMALRENVIQKAGAERKFNDTKSWAWHVSYHRKQIANLERELARHREKLNAATVKAKEEKKT
jgi:hypothetical protein